MNINAGTNQYNLSLKKMKEEKRPTFATIFDKLDARSKKLNPKNPLNAVMTNDQMYRYYLEETEPMLREIPDDYDLLDDVIGGKSLKDMKLSEFAKLLSGDLDGDRNVKYETLVATISPTPAAPIVPSMISIASPPTPPPSAPSAPSAPPPSAPVIPAPSSSVASSIAAPTAVSGLMPTGSGSIPTAPSGTGSAPSGTGSIPTAPAGTGSAPAPSGTGSAPAAAGSGLSVTIPSALSAVASAFSPSTYFASLLGGGTPPAAAITPPAAAAAAAKPSPSGASIPPSAVASAATTAPATGVPTATPASGALSPSAGAAGGGAAGGAAGGGGVSPSAVASSITATDTGYYDRFFTTSNTDTNPSIYNNALKAGLSPPKIPDSIAIKGDKFSSKNLEWVKHINDMNQYNKGINDPTGEFSFSFTPTQNKLINALEKNGNNAQKVYELIINKKIKL